MGLPTTTRGSSIKTLLPNEDSLRALFEILSNPDAVAYMVKKTEEKVEGLKKDFGILKVVNSFKENLKASQRDNSQIWNGILSTTSQFKNLNKNLGLQAAKEFTLKAKNKFDVLIALGDQSNLQRGFLIDGQAPTSEDFKNFDQLLNAWFAENNMVSQDSQLFEVDTEGKVLTDQQGNPIKVSKDKFKDKLIDSSSGFMAFCEKNGLQTTVDYKDLTKPAAQPNVESLAESTEPLKEKTMAPTPADDEAPSPSV